MDPIHPIPVVLANQKVLKVANQRSLSHQILVPFHNQVPVILSRNLKSHNNHNSHLINHHNLKQGVRRVPNLQAKLLSTKKDRFVLTHVTLMAHILLAGGPFLLQDNFPMEVIHMAKDKSSLLDLMANYQMEQLLCDMWLTRPSPPTDAILMAPIHMDKDPLAMTVNFQMVATLTENANSHWVLMEGCLIAPFCELRKLAKACHDLQSSVLMQNILMAVIHVEKVRSCQMASFPMAPIHMEKDPYRLTENYPMGHISTHVSLFPGMASLQMLAIRTALILVAKDQFNQMEGFLTEPIHMDEAKYHLMLVCPMALLLTGVLMANIQTTKDQ